MAIIKPLLSKIWGSAATGADLESPDPAKYASGWIFGEKPPNGWMNWLQYTFSAGLASLNEAGVLPWDNVTTYLNGAMVSFDGKVFKARLSNTGQSTTLPTYWQEQSLPDMPTSGDGYILYYSGSKLFWKDPNYIDYGKYEGRVASTKASLLIPSDEVIGNIPLASELNAGELAVNFAERTIYGKRPSDNVVVPLSGQASIVDNEFVVTAAEQGSFTPVGGYTVNQIEVFVNGRKIGKTEYIANNGLTVNFTGFTPVKDDLVVISVWASFGVSDAYSQLQVDALFASMRADRAGVTFDHAGTIAPIGSLPFGDTEYLIADYPELYGAIGDLWATTGGRTTPAVGSFRVPPQDIDGLGLFTRGTGIQNGVVGTYQADVFKSHTHNVTAYQKDTGGHYHENSNTLSTRPTAPYSARTWAGAQTTGDATETRPRSITMLKCIWTGK